MSTIKIHPKIIASIESCVTYDQINTCLNFTKFYPHNLDLQLKIVGLVQKKVYGMRNADLEEHVEEMRKIREKYN